MATFIFYFIGIWYIGSFANAGNATNIIIAFDQSAGTVSATLNRQKDLATSIIQATPENNHFGYVAYGSYQKLLTSLRTNKTKDELVRVIEMLPMLDMGLRNNTELFQYVQGYMLRGVNKIAEILMLFTTSTDRPSIQFAELMKEMTMKIFVVGLGSDFQLQWWKYIASPHDNHVFWVNTAQDLGKVRNQVLRQLQTDASFPCSTDTYLFQESSCKSCNIVCTINIDVRKQSKQCADICPYYFVHREPYPTEPSPATTNGSTSVVDGNENLMYIPGFVLGTVGLALTVLLTIICLCKHYKKGCFRTKGPEVTTHSEQPAEEEPLQSVHHVRAELD